MAELRRSKKVVLIHRVLWTTFLLILLVGADYLLGFVNDTRQIRETSRLFREEVAPLQIHTLNLVPNLRHTYFLAERPVADRLASEGAPRILTPIRWVSF